jgi:hypothetical protein
MLPLPHYFYDMQIYITEIEEFHQENPGHFAIHCIPMKC